MFRKMRNHSQELSKEDALKVLSGNRSGTLALHGDDGYPYAVPLNYALLDGCLYIHCAREGHKIDAIKANDKCSFAVIDLEEPVPERLTTRFRSVIVFGRIAIVEDAAERTAAMSAIMENLTPTATQEQKTNALKDGFPRAYLLRITPEHITGKCSYDLRKE